MLEVRLLGPVEVVGVGGSVDRLTDKLRRLVAVLSLKAGEIVPVSDLAEELWPEDPPMLAGNSLQAHISRLRRSLDLGEPRGPGRNRLINRAPGYLLVIGDEEVDVLRFKALRRQALEESFSGHPGEAIDTLERALNLWRGPALLGVAQGSLCVAAAARLNEMRIVTMTDMLDLKLRIGLHGEVLPELEELAASYPLEEPIHDLLMLALYRCGRQRQALAVYERLRRRLAEMLGLEPTPAFRNRMQAVLDHNPVLLVP